MTPGQTTTLLFALEDELSEAARVIFFNVQGDQSQIDQLVPSLGLDSSTVVLIDDIDEDSMKLVVSLIRSTSKENLSRFILLPRTQRLANRLNSELSGLTTKYELPPIQISEAFISQDSTSQISGIGLVIKDEPVEAPHATAWQLENHWLRGGLPNSLFAADEYDSYMWRQSYLASIADSMGEYWEIEPAHRSREILERLVLSQGHQLVHSKWCSDLNIEKPRLLHVLEAYRQFGLIREIPNWIESPHSVWLFRDSGLHLAAAGIMNIQQLQKNDQLYGHSWESFASESLIIACEGLAKYSYYRDNASNEIDLVLDFEPRSDEVLAIEFKASEREGVTNGFWIAAKKVRPTRRFVVHSGISIFEGENLQRIPLLKAISIVKDIVSGMKVMTT